MVSRKVSAAIGVKGVLKLEVIMAELIGRLMLTLVDAKTQTKTYTKVDAKTEANVETHDVADLPARQAIVAKTELSLHVWSLKMPSATH